MRKFYVSLRYVIPSSFIPSTRRNGPVTCYEDELLRGSQRDKASLLKPIPEYVLRVRVIGLEMHATI